MGGFRPGPPMPPPRRSGLGLVLGILALVLVVGVAAVGAVVLIVGHGFSSSDDFESSGDSGRVGDTASCPADRQRRAGDEVLADEMTSAIQKHREKAWTGLAGSDEARKAMSLWWSNVSAIGFTSGGAEASDRDQDLKNDSVVMTIGFHNKLDGTSDSTIGNGQVPDVAGTRYRIGTDLVAGSSGCHLVVDSFDSLGHAPWDGPARLTAIATRNGEVVGPVDQRTRLAALAGAVDDAVRWTDAFFDEVGHGEYLTQRGLIAFVPSTDQEARTWFRTTPAEGPIAEGTSFRLVGLQLTGGPVLDASGQKAPKVDEVAFGTGGTRSLITSAGTRLSTLGLEGLLVDQYVNATFAADDGSESLGGNLSSALVGGSGRFVQSYFLAQPASPATAASSGTSAALELLRRSIRPRFGSFDGRYPSDAQLESSGAAYDYYSALAASTFGYEADTTGVAFALQCIRDAYLQGGGPFDGVVSRIKGNNITFAVARQEQALWADWLRRTV